jgi:hypothetical protein
VTVEAVGVAATVLAAVVLLLVLAVVISSLPDLARYRRLRRM